MKEEEMHSLFQRRHALNKEENKMSYALDDLENYVKLCEALKERWKDSEIVQIKKKIGML